ASREIPSTRWRTASTTRRCRSPSASRTLSVSRSRTCFCAKRTDRVWTEIHRMSSPRQHDYSVQVTWTGNLGQGTRGYRAYARDHEISVPGKPTLPGSSDPAFRGDPGRYNPEELLIASLSACHMLWYLHLCADAGIVVLEYLDRASGAMRETPDGGGRFVE